MLRVPLVMEQSREVKAPAVLKRGRILGCFLHHVAAGSVLLQFLWVHVV